jgi:hypothetical protein
MPRASVFFVVFFVVFFIDVVLAVEVVLKGRAEALRYGVEDGNCSAALQSC